MMRFISWFTVRIIVDVVVIIVIIMVGVVIASIFRLSGSVKSLVTGLHAGHDQRAGGDTGARQKCDLPGLFGRDGLFVKLCIYLPTRRIILYIYISR